MVRYDKFFWGIAQDDRMQAVWQYTYGAWVNIRKGKWIELDNDVTDRVPWTVTGAGTSAYATDGTNKYFGTTTGKIAQFWGSTLFDTTQNIDIVDIKIMGTSMFFWTQSHTYVRTNYTDWNAWVLWGNVTQISTTYSDYRQFIQWGKNFGFFINWNAIGTLDADSPTTVWAYWELVAWGAFSTSSQLVGLTMHWNTLWAYSKEGKMFALDNQSEEVIGNKDFKETIIAVRNMGGWDMVITSSVDNQWVRSFIMNTWVSPESSQLIRRYRYSKTVSRQTLLENFGTRFWFENISVWNDTCFADCEWILYWVADADIGTPVIYSYGKTDNTLPDSFSVISYADDNSSWDEIIALWVENGYLMVSTYNWTGDWKIKQIKLYDLTDETYCDEWYIITKVDDFWQYEIPKTIKQVMLGADIPAWTSIKLEYSINEGEFVEYKTITNTDAIWTNGKKFEFSEPIDMFNEIAWKITLITTDETLTPKMYSFSHLIETELYEPSQ